MPLSKLLVREKGDTKDSKGIYLICQSKIEPEMYEFICKTVDERKTWIKVIRSGVLKCMEGQCSVMAITNMKEVWTSLEIIFQLF